MSKKEAIQVFEDRKVRTLWDDKTEEWYFSIVDVVAVLTDSVNPTAYWRKLKERLKKEENQTVTDCHGFKMQAPDGKMRKTDCADTDSFQEQKQVARQGGEVARNARLELEDKTGKKVVSSLNAKDAGILHLPDHGQEDAHE